MERWRDHVTTERFIVVAPPYSRRSGGIHTLHRLSGTLDRLGYSCRIAILDSEGTREAEIGELAHGISAPSLTEADEPLIAESIVIYPEIVTENILGAPRVVWYLLNRDGALGRGKINAGSQDYFLAHSKSIGDPRVRRILFCADYDPCFCLGDPPIPWGERHLTLTYVGKGNLHGPCQLVPASVALGQGWPRSQAELARLLQATKYLFTWDAWSAINTEAVLCGAVPVVMRWGPWTPEDVQLDEIGPLPLLDYGEHVLGGEWKLRLFSHWQRELADRIAALRASWDTRVRIFAEEVIAHF